MRPTLVFVRHVDLGDRAFRFGDELPPNFLKKDVIDRLLDSGRLQEHRERRSLFRIFYRFAGCEETEPLTHEELDALTLQP